MKLRISLLTILIGMLFASCGISTGKVAEQKEEGISVLRYDKLLSEYVRSNSFSAMQKLTMDYRHADKDSDRRCTVYRYGEGRYHFATSAKILLGYAPCFVC